MCKYDTILFSCRSNVCLHIYIVHVTKCIIMYMCGLMYIIHVIIIIIIITCTVCVLACTVYSHTCTCTCTCTVHEVDVSTVVM